MRVQFKRYVLPFLFSVALFTVTFLALLHWISPDEKFEAGLFKFQNAVPAAAFSPLKTFKFSETPGQPEYMLQGIRRVGALTHEVHSKTAVVFIGCSFTFGEGVEFAQSFAGLFEKRYPKIAFYNFGRRGGAPNEDLELLQTHPELFNIGPHDQIILVYTFIRDHILRESCSTQCLKPGHEWMLDKPHYLLDADHRPVLDGTHGDYLWRNSLTQFLVKTEFFRNRDFPALYTPAHYELHEALLDAVHGEISKRIQISDAYHFWGLANSPRLTNELLSYVEKTPFKSVVLDPGLIPGIEHYDLFLPDGHPNALGHEVMFRALEWQLKKDHPDLFGKN